MQRCQSVFHASAVNLEPMGFASKNSCKRHKFLPRRHFVFRGRTKKGLSWLQDTAPCASRSGAAPHGQRAPRCTTEGLERAAPQPLPPHAAQTSGPQKYSNPKLLESPTHRKRPNSYGFQKKPTPCTDAMATTNSCKCSGF